MKILYQIKKIIRFIENKMNPYINIYNNKEIEKVQWEEKIIAHFNGKKILIP